MDNEVFNSIVQTLKSDLVEVTKPDCDSVAEIVNEAKGSRTLNEYADASGISAPTLSRILNGKITRPISIPNIVSLISASEMNTLGTMHRLARASGYMSRSEQSALRGRIQLRQVREGLYASLKQVMLTVVVAELFQRGAVNDSRLLESESGTIPAVNDLAVRYDFAFNISEEGKDSSWHFFCLPQSTEDYKTNPVSAEDLAKKMIQALSPLFLTDSWVPSQYEGTKLSFCFIDSDVFEEFCRLMDCARLNNRFSAILIDDEQNRVVEERCFRTNSGEQTDSLFNLPVLNSISFDDDTIADEIGDNNFLIMTEGFDGGEDE